MHKKPDLDLAEKSEEYVAGLFDSLELEKPTATTELDVALAKQALADSAPTDTRTASQKARDALIERNKTSWRSK